MRRAMFITPVHELLTIGHITLTPPGDTHVTNGKSHEPAMTN